MQFRSLNRKAVASMGGAQSALRSAGFSLIEMLAVIVLIGLIAAVVVNQVGKNVQKGKYNAAKAQVKSLSMKVENYMLDNGSPPQRLEDLISAPGNASGWNGPYARESEIKDPWGKPLIYKYPGEHGDFDLTSYAADGSPGGDSFNKDVGNWE